VVTTRRRGEKPANENLDKDDTINVYVPQTPKRKLNKISKLQDEDEEETFYTPPTSKKPRVGKKSTSTSRPSEESPANSRLVVEIPAMIPPPAADIVNLEVNGEGKKIKKPLPVRVRNGGSKLAEVVTLDPEDDVVEEESSGDVNGGNKEDEREGAEDDSKDNSEDHSMDDLEDGLGENTAENDAQEAVMESLPAMNPPPISKEALLADIGRKSSDHGNSQTTDTLVPLSIRGSTLPDLLPAEFLQDEEKTPSTAEVEAIQPKSKGTKTTFADVVNAVPKDRRIGTTTYRVAKPRSLELAPKASAQARSMKDDWMQGRSGKKGVSNRKPFSSGFFVNR
jgi:hypothetical protein